MSIGGYTDYINTFAFGKDNQTLVTTIDNLAHLWDLKDGVKLGAAQIHDGYIKKSFLVQTRH